MYAEVTRNKVLQPIPIFLMEEVGSGKGVEGEPLWKLDTSTNQLEQVVFEVVPHNRWHEGWDHSSWVGEYHCAVLYGVSAKGDRTVEPICFQIEGGQRSIPVPIANVTQVGFNMVSRIVHLRSFGFLF